MKTLHTEVEIDAAPERVWQVLTDFARFAEWNPFIVHASGELRVGSRLSVQLKPPGMRVTSLRPVVVAITPNRELRWLGHALVPGMFSGEHAFVLEPLGPERTRFVQRERFTGLLVPLLASLLDGRTREGFEAMNEALRLRACAEPPHARPQPC